MIPRPLELRDHDGEVVLAPGSLRVEERADDELGPEGYRLAVGDEGVRITAARPAGAFYARQTLRLLLPPETIAAPPEDAPEWRLPRVEIVDRPRFAWRGVHLDVARHFMPIEWIHRLVDLAALHKLNVLHLHLTDDQGWRVEIERYPRLTEIGAWRRESMAGHYTEARFDGTPHGGFYTQDELRRLVAYADERHVTVLPEIDLPGHMQAAIAAYPELGNTGEAGEVRTAWGISEHVLNVDESTVRFCTAVLDEVLEIFPSRYVHVGGDECPKEEWRASPRAQELMRERGLADEDELQSWFMRRLGEHLEARGRIMVGWDEILEGGLAPGAVVISWRGESGGIAAAEAGHDVVMAPEEFTYLDWAQSADPGEPVAIHPGRVTDLAEVYGYEPVPAELPAGARRHVLGAQAQLWTEYVPDPTHAEYMYFPRLCAFAEVVWSEGPRDVRELEPRLREHLKRLDALGVNYRAP